MKRSHLYRMPSGWGFDPERGCIFHPGGLLTSWVRRDGKSWRASELAGLTLPAKVWAALDAGARAEVVLQDRQNKPSSRPRPESPLYCSGRKRFLATGKGFIRSPYPFGPERLAVSLPFVVESGPLNRWDRIYSAPRPVLRGMPPFIREHFVRCLIAHQERGEA